MGDIPLVSRGICLSMPRNLPGLAGHIGLGVYTSGWQRGITDECGLSMKHANGLVYKQLPEDDDLSTPFLFVAWKSFYATWKERRVFIPTIMCQCGSTSFELQYGGSGLFGKCTICGKEGPVSWEN
jgi:hypothetical protein